MKEKIQQFLYEIFGYKPEVIPLKNKGRLPLLLVGTYDFFTVTIHSIPFVLMIDRHQMELSPAEIQKQSHFITEALRRPTVYATESLPAYQCKRLIERKVPFVIPGKQLFMPFLGILFSQEKKIDYKKYEHLPICAQEILLMVLNGIFNPTILFKDLFTLLSYSRQTIFTALDALESFALITKENRGRTKVLQFPTSRSFFSKVFRYLDCPVRRIVGMETPDPIKNWAVDAGETLLSQRTMIAEPRRREMAISLTQFNRIQSSLSVIPLQGAPIALQLWRRSPLLPTCCEIDNVSLFLSLKDNPDERIQMALDELRKDKIG